MSTKYESAEEAARELLENAERTNKERDQIERDAGLAALSDCPPDMVTRTAITALCAGIQMRDWDCVAEATCMLADITDFRPWSQQ